MCYILKLECGEFTFRPPAHAKITADGFSWQCDAEDLARLEADIEEMDFGPSHASREDLESEAKEAEERAELSDRAFHRVKDALRAAKNSLAIVALMARTYDRGDMEKLLREIGDFANGATGEAEDAIND